MTSRSPKSPKNWQNIFYKVKTSFKKNKKRERTGKMKCTVWGFRNIFYDLRYGLELDQVEHDQYLEANTNISDTLAQQEVALLLADCKFQPGETKNQRNPWICFWQLGSQDKEWSKGSLFYLCCCLMKGKSRNWLCFCSTWHEICILLVHCGKPVTWLYQFK